MKYRLPPLNGLLAFEAAARSENFARAAKELNLTQSAVSHRVRLLENYLGYPLFERLPRGLRLTESGKAYLPSIRQAFEQIFSSTTGIFGVKGKGLLTVRAPISYSALWLSPIITRFQQQYPGIEVRLISSIWAEGLASDETDIDLRLGFGNWPGCEAQLLYKDQVLPVCYPKLLRRLPVKDIGDLAQQPHIHIMGVEDMWMKYFAQVDLNFEVKSQDIHVDSAVAALEIASASDCYALIQKRFLTPYLNASRLTVALDFEMEIEQGIYLVQPESRKSLKPEAILFKDWLQEQLATEA